MVWFDACARVRINGEDGVYVCRTCLAFGVLVV